MLPTLSGKRIVEARKLLGWGQRTLARQSRRTQLAVRQAETGTLPDAYAESVLSALWRTLKAGGINFKGGRVRLTRRPEPC